MWWSDLAQHDVVGGENKKAAGKAKVDLVAHAVVHVLSLLRVKLVDHHALGQLHLGVRCTGESYKGKKIFKVISNEFKMLFLGPDERIRLEAKAS